MSELKKAQEALEKKAKSYDARKARWIQTSQESEPHKESLNLVRGIHWHMTAIRGKSYETWTKPHGGGASLSRLLLGSPRWIAR